MIRGPAQKPRRAASPTVRVNNGPGIKAPESATMNDVMGTPANNHQSIEDNFLSLPYVPQYNILPYRARINHGKIRDMGAAPPPQSNLR